MTAAKTLHARFLPPASTPLFVIVEKCGDLEREICRLDDTLPNGGSEYARLFAAAPALRDLLRRLVDYGKPDRWGYGAAALALDDAYRNEVKALLASLKGDA
jgi:hypothetical protein